MEVDIIYFFTGVPSNEVKDQGKKIKELEQEILQLLRAIKGLNQGTDIIKKRNTLIVFLLLSKLIKQDMIFIIMNSPNFDECFDWELKNDLSKNINAVLERETSLIKYEKEVYTFKDGDLYGKHYFLNQIYDELIEVLKEYKID